MDITAVKELKEKTESNLKLIINQFEQLTSCKIISVKILRNEFVLNTSIGLTDLEEVKIEVRV